MEFLEKSVEPDDSQVESKEQKLLRLKAVYREMWLADRSEKKILEILSASLPIVIDEAEEDYKNRQLHVLHLALETLLGPSFVDIVTYLQVKDLDGAVNHISDLYNESQKKYDLELSGKSSLLMTPTGKKLVEWCDNQPPPKSRSLYTPSQFFEPLIHVSSKPVPLGKLLEDLPGLLDPPDFSLYKSIVNIKYPGLAAIVTAEELNDFSLVWSHRAKEIQALVHTVQQAEELKHALLYFGARVTAVNE